VREKARKFAERGIDPEPKNPVKIKGLKVTTKGRNTMGGWTQEGEDSGGRTVREGGT